MFENAKTLVTREESPFRVLRNGRLGTAICSKAQLTKLFGKPSPHPDRHGKVKWQWLFKTPQGLAEIRDYYWNRSDEWSLSADDERGVEWLIAMLKENGIEASRGDY